MPTLSEPLSPDLSHGLDASAFHDLAGELLHPDGTEDPRFAPFLTSLERAVLAREIAEALGR